MPSTASSTPAPSATIRIHVNDAGRSVAASTSLLTLLDEMALSHRPGIAVAVNASVVPRTEWAARPLCNGDRVLVIHASQGG
jgi:sulfur carrier protein